MTTFKKVLSESPFSSPNQEEDSEEEAKLKYERLSNGVTEILKNDAASCMTVHDKVKVIIHPPPRPPARPAARAFQLQVQSFQETIPLCLCVHLRDVIFKVGFHPCCSICNGSPFFSHLCLLFLSGRCIKRHYCLFLFLFPLLHIFRSFPICWMLIFLRGTLLSEMLNRRGTSSTLARLSRAKVIPSYVSPPDVLLTAADFHLFICFARFFSYPPKQASAERLLREQF